MLITGILRNETAVYHNFISGNSGGAPWFPRRSNSFANAFNGVFFRICSFHPLPNPTSYVTYYYAAVC